MKRSEFRFFDRLRVRWAEVDMQKIVFNGHYLMYFDTAVAAYWRAMAMPYHETMEALHGDLFVRKATLEYLGSARYDEVCEVGMRCQRIGNSSMLFVAALFRGDTLLVYGELVYVFAEPFSQQSQAVPDKLRAALQAFEAGETMFEVRSGTWAAQCTEAMTLREAVFTREQGIALPFLSDEADAAAVHVLAHNRFGLAVGTGRLALLGSGQGKVGRMAVLPQVRGAGVGRALLAALAAAGRERGLAELVLHAQSSAVGFYGGAGFVRDGEPFEEVGITHQAMRLALN